MPARSRRRLAPLLVLAVLALASWARVSGHARVFTGGTFIPQVDGDSFYHVHRALAVLRHFPSVPHRDPQIAWPDGAFVPWADGFDLAAGAFAGALGGASQPHRAALGLALWPVVLGIAVVFATMRLARALAPGRSWAPAATVAGVCAALVPDGVVNSQLGRVDHHVFEALVVTLLTRWTLRRFSRAPASARRDLLFELEGAAIVAVALFGFTGSPLYVAIAALPLAWAALRDGRAWGAGACGLFVGAVAGAFLSLPAALEHRQWLAFRYPSLLQPALVAVVGGGLALLGWCGAAGAQRAVRRAAAVVAAGLAATLALVAFAPSAVAEVVGGVSGWLLHRDPWLTTVGEFEPLLPRGIALARVHALFGWVGFVAPLALAGHLACHPRRAAAPTRAFLWSLGCLLALTLEQNRFSRPLVPLLSVAVGVALTGLLRRMAARGRPRRLAAWGPALALAAFALDPASARALLPARPGGLDAYLEAALDLRDVPPAPGVQPGVLVDWGVGHQVQLLAGLPVVADGFGSYLGEKGFWDSIRVFGGTEPELEEYLRTKRAGIVLAGVAALGPRITGVSAPTAIEEGRLGQRHMTRYPLSPLLIAGSAIPGWEVRHLPHLMPRFASRSVVTGLAFPLPFVWGYERVPGALVAGHAPRAGRVLAELPFTEHGRSHTYRAFVDAGPDGAWELTLPFPSGLVRPTLRSAPRWTFAVEGGPHVELEIPEEAVRGGARLSVDLRHPVSSPARP